MNPNTINLTDALMEALRPAAACPRCGGWTTMGGMSQHSDAHVPVHGRFGCVCENPDLARRIVTRLNVLTNLPFNGNQS
jgi:hypothetical protein